MMDPSMEFNWIKLYLQLVHITNYLATHVIDFLMNVLYVLLMDSRIMSGYVAIRAFAPR